MTPEHADAARCAVPGVLLAAASPLGALQALARAWRRALGARVIAVTGSTGKTSTKDILATLLSSRMRTVASRENLNTEIGLPLAILEAPAGTQALVLELAMRGPGQIAELVGIAEPDTGVIVNVGPVHLELLGSLERIAAAKAELIAGLPPGGTAVVPAGEPLLARHLRSDLTTVSFGSGGDVWLVSAEAGQVVVASGSERLKIAPSFSSAHQLNNLLAAVAAAQAVGVRPEGVLEVRFSALRGERIALPGGIVIVNDCYNANPMSVAAAVDDLARAAPGRRVAVIGDMLELGPGERDYHVEAGARAAAAGIELLVTVGPLAATMAEGFRSAQPGLGRRAPRHVATTSAEEAAALLPGLLIPGDTVLVKGSRGVGLERVAEVLVGQGRVDPGGEG